MHWIVIFTPPSARRQISSVMLAPTRICCYRSISLRATHLGSRQGPRSLQEARRLVDVSSSSFQQTCCLATSTSIRATGHVRSSIEFRRNNSSSSKPPAIPANQPEVESPSNSDDHIYQAQNSRMRIQFKCIATSNLNQNDPIKPVNPSQACGHLNTHEFSSQAFHHGIVLVQCPACLNRHLIADHLQWFTSNPTADDPNFKEDHRTIVDILRAKGESVKRGRVINQLTPPDASNASTTSASCKNPSGSVQAHPGEVLEFYE